MFKRFIFVCLIILAFLFFDKYNDKDKLVFKEIDNNYYDIFTIEINNLNTNNFSNYFVSDKVLKIIPKNNPVYISKIDSFDFNTASSNAYNIKKFINIYLASVDSYYNEKEKYIISGIPIKRVVLYSSNERINELISIFKKDIVVIK